MNVGFILARGGSKGIPRKNIKPLAGVPLIHYTIQAATHSKLLDAVYLTTEDDEIASVAQESQAGPVPFHVFKRPSCLALDSVQSDEVFLFLLRQLQEQGIDPDTLVLLQPTSPLRNTRHIDEAIELYYERIPEGLHTVVSCSVADGFYWRLGDSEEEIVPVHHNPVRRMGRQWIQKWDKMYKENGAIYVCDSVRLSLDRAYRLPPYTVYEMSERDSVDLDTPEDWEMAERLLSG